jgi:quinol monooxygenase YgiN
MTENVYWVIEVDIKPGRFEEFKTLAATVVEATQKNEVGTLNYEWAISDDQKSCHVYERYQNSAAVMVHLKSFGEHFAKRFAELGTTTRFVVYGAPSAEVKNALGANVVYMAPLMGFSR